MSPKLSVMRLALTGAVTLAVLFLLCWLGAVAWSGGGLSHMFIALFTAAPVTSLLALSQGLCWAAIFGGLSGAVLALSYNGLSFVDEAKQPR